MGHRRLRLGMLNAGKRHGNGMILSLWCRARMAQPQTYRAVSMNKELYNKLQPFMEAEMSVFNRGPIGTSQGMKECKRDIKSEIEMANDHFQREINFRDALYAYISDEYYGTEKFSLAELVGSVELQILFINRRLERLAKELELEK